MIEAVLFFQENIRGMGGFSTLFNDGYGVRRTANIYLDNLRGFCLYNFAYVLKQIREKIGHVKLEN